VALLYREYLEFLGSERVDPEGMLDLARGRMRALSWLNGAEVWIDGFAGLTRQQLRMVVGLAGQAARVDLALLLDPRRSHGPGVPPDELSLFARTERTWADVLHAAGDAGVPVEKPELLRPQVPPRFRACAALAEVERRLFSTGGAGSPPPGKEATGDEAIRLCRAADARAEVNAAVDRIVELAQARGLRYRDIAIVVRDLEPYHDLISASLAAHGIPFFIDRRRPVHHHPLIQLIRAAASMHAGTPIDQAVTLALKSGLAGPMDEAADALENYLLAHGLSAPEAWDEEWVQPPRRPETGQAPSFAEQRELRAINEARAAVRKNFGDWWPGAAPAEAAPCRVWVERLHGLLDRLVAGQWMGQWCEQAAARGDLDEAEEHEQAWSGVMRLLEELAEGLGGEPMTGRQFRDCLEAGLSELTLGMVPATLDQVLVSSIERSRHPPIRAMFVLGLADGLFPARLSEDPLLADDDRSLLQARGIELGPTRARRLLDERMLAYVALTRPGEYLWVSYPVADAEGREMQPSPFWEALREAAPGAPVGEISAGAPSSVGTVNELAGALAAEARAWSAGVLPPERMAGWWSLYDWARQDPQVRPALAKTLAALTRPRPGRLSAEATEALWPGPWRTSVTALENFARCPFRHFAAHGLKLRPRARHELASIDLGRLYHQILEQFVNELLESNRQLGDLADDTIAAHLARCCSAVLPEYARTVRLDERIQRAAERQGKSELAVALSAAKAGLGRTPLRPRRTELAFGLPREGALPALVLDLGGGRSVELQGVIDRVDVVPRGEEALAVVFDYKRRLDNRLRLDEVFHGLALQLLAYLLVLRHAGEGVAGGRVVPGGAFYLPLLGKLQAVDRPAEATADGFDPFKSLRPRGVIDFDSLGALDPGAESGGRSRVFNARGRKEDEEIGDFDRSDAVRGGQLDLILGHVDRKMRQLAAGWLSGDIRVAPARRGQEVACTNCLFGGACRFEPASGQARSLDVLKRAEALQRMAAEEGGGG
jgi:ATP-dependent helicase/nuclease subunit B